MTTVSMNSTQQTRLQDEVQRELERREWAEPGDNVMAEYVTVLIANGNNRDRVQAEMDDLVGADFDVQFLDWLFDKASGIQQADAPAAPTSRILTSALASTREDTNKRKSDASEAATKKRVVDLPSGPRAMVEKSLQDRMGPRQMQVRGAGRPAVNHAFQPGFRPPMQPGFGFFPAQHEMMAQMMMMQSSMAQMGQMMQKMAEEKETVAAYGTEAPAKPVKVPSAKPAPMPKAIPTKPSSKALCKYSVGCTNARCIYSHPSPVADEKTGMVLSEEACENGRNCKDAECIKSHVSPAAGGTGPTRLLCKYQNCTNPACPFRHVDSEGNSMPPPALSAPPKEIHPSSDNEDGDVEVVMTHKGLMDGALDDKKAVVACRYGERCTRPDCKFTHPPSRATPKPRGYSIRGGRKSGDNVSSAGMSKSKKFGESLNPGAEEFKPKSQESVAI